MYTEHWGLNASPFSGTGGRKTFFESDAQAEAIARIDYLINQNRRLGLLLGDEGLGKSTIMNHVRRQLRRQRLPVAYLNATGMDHSEMVINLAQGLGAVHETDTPLNAAWHAIFDCFQTNRYQHLNTVILIDDAHEAESDVLSAIVRLCQWCPAGKSRVTVILAAESDKAELIGRRLLQLSELRVELEPWEQEDTIAFIRKLMIHSGATRRVFDVRAIEEIQRLSGGVPRRIVQLSELALVAGAGMELDRVDVDSVQAVEEELRQTVSV